MTKSMRIAVASGKGGTGKTTLATSLATALALEGRQVAYLDCDVEEPNGHIFLRPTITNKSQVTIPVPEVDESKCTYCRECSRVCMYSAILVMKEKILTFPKLCHGCGGCFLACQEKAIREVPRPIGIIEEGMAEEVKFVHGRLDVGEAMSPPLIKAVQAKIDSDQYNNSVIIMDSPPGTSCPVIESVKNSDVVLLVTEPTPFGLNDLKLAVEMVRALGIPFGVAVNRAGIGDREVFRFCDNENIPVLLELEDERKIAECYSRGELIVKALPEYKALFVDLAKKLFKLADGPRPQVVHHEKPFQSAKESPPLPSDGLPSGNISDVKELVVISGKGGTGKTSVLASFFALADKPVSISTKALSQPEERAVAADCDVDAADLHLVLDPQIHKRWPFSGGSIAKIDPDVCNECGLCVEHCRFEAINSFQVDPISCEGCGVCTNVCPIEAAKMCPSLNGEWFISGTRHGFMVHARLGIAQENSGKLVSLVRREARAVAITEGHYLLLVDGSPGIGCPVIASITGANMVLIVTEPTLSGIHDMRRVAELTRHFNVQAAVCINKYDINLDLSDQIVHEAQNMNIEVLGQIRYDTSVTRAQVNRKAVVEYEDSLAAKDIRALWERVKGAIG